MLHAGKTFLVFFRESECKWRSVVYVYVYIITLMLEDERIYRCVPIIIIIIIIIIRGISFMQGIHTYIPETNHVPKEHCVATILMQLF